jgi:hypothetical protein
MNPQPGRQPRVAAKLRWLVWCAYVVLWTAALLVPVPTHGPVLDELDAERRYLFAKAVHVAAYLVFAVLTGWVRAPARWRWLLVFGLAAHGTATELLQWALANYTQRTGQLTDVGLDHLGVALGLLISWKWWSAADAPAGDGLGTETAPLEHDYGRPVS